MAAAAEAVALLEALRGQVAAVTEHGLGLLGRVRGGRLRTEKGVSLLEVRAQALLQYLQDLALLLGTKARGGALGGLPALPRLLETRLVLEKLRPIEHRLKYQLEKLLQAAMTGGRGDNDPLRFRPDPANMAAQEEEEEEEGQGGAKAPGLGGGRRYVPPRLVPVQYDAVGQEREQRAREAARRRALSSSVIRELREELSEAPQELGGAGGAFPPPRASRLRTQYEEAMLVRLSETKRERAKRRQAAAAGGGLAAITHFGDIGALLEPTNQEAPPPQEEEEEADGEEGEEEEGFPSPALSPPIKEPLSVCGSRSLAPDYFPRCWVIVAN
ncbi:LOW QUALITY PROTEIN: neuroguidin [Accipiter gentilis]|uniref:LOW QUALITY PROTEIN: neuroguidin n=1 Tax=Astur gentilis TaxID=8957 RepID=UPI002110A8B7|nr:LOW QUALITY PROTEIN: neuroguidin [Accipiter gentilis]